MSLHYCSKCGRTLETFKENDTCDCCGNTLKPIPDKYFENFWWRDGDGKQVFIKEVIEQSPDLDPYLYAHRTEILNQKAQRIQEAMDYAESLKTNNKGVSCPYCKSSNIKRIGTVRRIISTSVLGLASGKIGKQWHCNNCGSDF